MVEPIASRVPHDPDASREDVVQAAYDRVPYPASSHPATAPSHLSAMAALHGLKRPHDNKFRYLELGCADGGNIIPLAYAYPECTFVGVDLSPRQIAMGAATAQRLSLQNVQLTTASITALNDNLGTFDYIVAHGVFSWVTRPVQVALLANCRRFLAPQGVAYISYNTYPGAYAVRGIRDLLLRGTRHLPEIHDQGALGVQLVAQLARASTMIGQDRLPYLEALQSHLETTPGAQGYLIHEYLADHNEPFYLHEFQSMATAAHLQVVGDAQPGQTAPESLPDEAREALQPFAHTRADMEQLVDFLRNTSFRRSLLCHADPPLAPAIRPEHLDELFATADVTPLSPPRPGPAKPMKFRTAKQRTFSSEHPVSTFLLLKLADAWPEALPVGVLLREAAAAHPPGAGHGGPTPAAILLSLFLSGVLNLRADRARCAVRLPDRPAASVLARLQALDSPVVMSLMHHPVLLDAARARRLIQALDGRRSVPELAAWLASTTPPSGPAQTGETATPTQIAAVRQDLQQLLRLGLLLPPERGAGKRRRGWSSWFDIARLRCYATTARQPSLAAGVPSRPRKSWSSWFDMARLRCYATTARQPSLAAGVPSRSSSRQRLTA